MIKILIAGKYNDSIQKVKTLADSLPQDISVVDIAMDEQSAMEMIDSKMPDVVVITLDTGDREMINVAQKIYVYKPRIITCVYGHNMDTALFSQLVSSGVRNAGEYPEDAQSFLATLKNLVDVESTRTGYLTNTHSALLTSSTIIGFYSPKAGAGTTTCAVNTAVTLAKRGKKVILVDLDLEFGDAHTFLDLKPKKSISDLCTEFEKDTYSISDIESYCELHTSGVYVLSAPKSPEFAEKVTIEQISSIFAILKVYFEYIIVDLPDGLSARHAELFGLMNRIYFVTPLQLSSVMAAKQAISVIGVLGKRDNVNVIVNRSAKTDLISVQDLHKILNTRIILNIPSDYKAAINVANRGIPIVSALPNHPISRAFKNLTIYTLSKNTSLDIFDMSASEVQKAYQKLDTKNPKQTVEKNEVSILKKLNRRQMNGRTA